MKVICSKGFEADSHPSRQLGWPHEDLHNRDNIPDIDLLRRNRKHVGLREPSPQHNQLAGSEPPLLESASH